MTLEPTCPSCGVPYSEHPGLTSMCEKLRQAETELARLRAAIGHLQQELHMSQSREVQG